MRRGPARGQGLNSTSVSSSPRNPSGSSIADSGGRTPGASSLPCRELERGARRRLRRRLRASAARDRHALRRVSPSPAISTRCTATDSSDWVYGSGSSPSSSASSFSSSPGERQSRKLASRRVGNAHGQASRAPSGACRSPSPAPPARGTRARASPDSGSTSVSSPSRTTIGRISQLVAQRLHRVRRRERMAGGGGIARRGPDLHRHGFLPQAPGGRAREQVRLARRRAQAEDRRQPGGAELRRRARAAASSRGRARRGRRSAPRAPAHRASRRGSTGSRPRSRPRPRRPSARSSEAGIARVHVLRCPRAGSPSAPRRPPTPRGTPATFRPIGPDCPDDRDHVQNRLMAVEQSTSSERVLAAREQYVPRGIATPPIVVARAEGARVEDVDGRTYIDFAGGLGCQNTGHGFPPAVAAMHEQIDTLPPPVLHGRDLRAVRRGLPPARRALALRGRRARRACS